MLNILLQAAVIASTAISTAAAIPTISVKGSKFFANGQQFFLKGVAYQGTPDDPLVQTKQCQLDAQLMQTIGANSIRVYHIDPTANHDGCMKAFADAGIYIWLDLDTFDTSIRSGTPAWTKTQFLAFSKVMDVMQGYDNLAGFWIGNEVIFTNAQSNAAPVVRAATADMKAYMASKKYRTIPIGYSAADIAELRPMLQNYLACDPDPKNNVDFFGLNSYEWCGDSSFTTSGYSKLQEISKGYSIPIFFSETGCNQPAPRLFTDQAAIFGPEMVDTWSGSIIYEWVQEVNNFGLVNYGPNGQIYNGAPIPMQPGFDNIAAQWKNATPTGIAESAYTPSFKAPACPSATGGWQVNGNVPLPTLAKDVIAAAASSIANTSAPYQSNGTLSSGNYSTTLASLRSATSSVAGSVTLTPGIFAPTASSFGSGIATGTGSPAAASSAAMPSTSILIDGSPAPSAAGQPYGNSVAGAGSQSQVPAPIATKSGNGTQNAGSLVRAGGSGGSGLAVAMLIAVGGWLI